ncbi:MAG: IS110 family transposase [Ardenticatenaceae bacterium]
MGILQNARLERGVTYCKNESDEMVQVQTLVSVNGITDASDTDYINLYLSQLPPSYGPATKSSAGIDIHKTFVVAAVVVSFAGTDQRFEFVREFEVSQDGLLKLGQWLKLFPLMTDVAMEATSTYWKPVNNALAPLGYNIILLNPMLLKYIDKTDVKDALQIARLNHYDLLKASMVVGPEQEDLRRMTRLMDKTIDMRTAYSNRIEDELTRCSIFLTHYVKVLSVSGRNIINAIISGETDPEKLILGYRGNKYRGQNAQVLIDALVHVPEIRPAGRAILGRLMEAIDFCDRHIDEYKADIRAMVSEIEYVVPLTGEILSGEELVTLIRTAPRIGESIAWTIISEMGTEITLFPTAGHYASFAGFIPSNRITGGKKVKDGTKPGNSHVHSKVVQAGQGILNGWSGRIPLAEKAWQYLSRCGNKLKAVSMVGRELMQGLWHMLMKGEPWKDKDPNQTMKVRQAQERSIRRAVKQAEDLSEVLGGAQLVGELKELVERVMNDLGELLGQSPTTLRMSKEYEDGPINQANIPKRAASCLLAAGIEKISALLALVLSQTLVEKIKGIGPQLESQIIQGLINDGYLYETAS